MRLRGSSVILLLSSLIVLAGCSKAGLGESVSPSHESQPDCGFVQNVYGERISWKGKTPIVMSIHESVPPEDWPAIDAAIKDWETALGHPVFQIKEYGAKGPLDPRQDGVNMIYYMNTWEPDRTSEQARTSVYWVGNEIREADVRIDAANFTFYVTTPNSTKDVHMESLMVHELGHVLGLKHRDTGGSVMATYLSADTERDKIGSIDVDSVRCEY